MENAADILLIIVSSVLTLFLILAIIVCVYAISIFRQVKRVLQRAENVAINVEAAAEAFERNAKPLAVIKLISNIIGQVTKARGKKE